VPARRYGVGGGRRVRLLQRSGRDVAPAAGATTFDKFMVPSWIFGEVSVGPDLEGQPIVGQGVFTSNPTASPVTLGILFGLWAADGPGGEPGILLNVGVSATRCSTTRCTM